MNLVWEWPECPEGPMRREDTAVFFKVGKAYGGLSNMSNEYPLEVNGVRVKSSEALFQACRFPHRPDWQQEVLDAPHAMRAKMAAKKEGRRRHHSRPDWEAIRVDVMRWCLQVKLAQHRGAFGDPLLSTEGRAIVERSRKDDFWGAKPAKDNPSVLHGANVLGRLLMDLREALRASNSNQLGFVEPLDIPDFLLLGEPIRRIDCRARRLGLV